MTGVAIPFGIEQIDQSLRDALLKAGGQPHEADELARMSVCGGSPPGAFVEGLRACAILLNEGNPKTLDWGVIPQPWGELGPALLTSGSTSAYEVALQYFAECYDTEQQAAFWGIMGSVLIPKRVTVSQPQPNGAITAPQPAPDPPRKPKILTPPDAAVQGLIQQLLHKPKVPEDLRRQQAGEQLLEWLVHPDNGALVRTTGGGKFYLWHRDHRVLRQGTEDWEAWLTAVTGTNRASTDFKFLNMHVVTATQFDGELREVVRLAHWDDDTQILRISRFNGQVYRLDGQTIETETNGDGPVLFEDYPLWLPYTPDFSGQGRTLDWSCELLPQWESHRQEFSLAFRVWWLSTFFSELCPAKPMLLLTGPKGSGKSTAARVMLRLLFGNQVDVAGLPDKPDDFRAATSNNHILFIDNVDAEGHEQTQWRDKLATLATGKIEQLRRLYTTNDVETVVFRCWLGMTSRTPDMLRRADVTERLVTLSFRRLQDSDRGLEHAIYRELAQKRNRWWGDVLTQLNLAVRAIREQGLEEHMGFRMEDWASLGVHLAGACNRGALWRKTLALLRQQQQQLMLDDNLVVLGISTWLENQALALAPKTVLPAILTRDLYEICKIALFNGGFPDSAWPRSSKAFGKQLADIHEELAGELSRRGIKMQWRTVRGNRAYIFTLAEKVG